MKYCPRCGDEFVDDAGRCEECRENLITEAEWESRMAKRKHEDEEVFVKVKTVENQFEADVVKDALDKEGIPVLVRSFQDTSFDGIFVSQKGWGIIEVPEKLRGRAKEVISALDAAKNREHAD